MKFFLNVETCENKILSMGYQAYSFSPFYKSLNCDALQQRHKIMQGRFFCYLFKILLFNLLINIFSSLD